MGDPTALDQRVELVVVGAHLDGQPLNHQLTERGAVLLSRTTTAPAYRLFRLPGDEPARPGLRRVAAGGRPIAVEVWSLPVAGFGSFVAQVPPPLAIGKIELADGRWVSGFVCEPIGFDDADDITDHGGWVAFLAG